MARNEKNITLLEKTVQTSARVIEDPAGRQVKVLQEEDAEKLCSSHGQPRASVYVAALRQGILPYRYLRNRDSVTLDMQLKLAESRVGVIGAGGLGGHVILLLARLGIGSLVVVDGDAFDETNQNRQALSNMKNRGVCKALEARFAVASVNPGVEVIAHPLRLDGVNGKEILAECRVVVDALDNVADRFILEEIARGLRIPLVHGAVAGF